jgi:hypothetical protein
MVGIYGHGAGMFPTWFYGHFSLNDKKTVLKGARLVMDP